MTRLASILSLVLLCGCHTDIMPNETHNHYPAQVGDAPPMPPLDEAPRPSMMLNAVQPVPVSIETNTLAWECERCNETGIEGSRDLVSWVEDAVLPSWVYVPPTNPAIGGGFIQRTNFVAKVITTNEPARFWRAFSR